MIASSSNKAAAFAARNALRNIFVHDAEIHPMNEGIIGDPIPYECETDGGNYTVDLVRRADPDEWAAHNANARVYGESGD